MVLLGQLKSGFYNLKFWQELMLVIDVSTAYRERFQPPEHHLRSIFELESTQNTTNTLSWDENMTGRFGWCRHLQPDVWKI